MGRGLVRVRGNGVPLGVRGAPDAQSHQLHRTKDRPGRVQPAAFQVIHVWGSISVGTPIRLHVFVVDSKAVQYCILLDQNCFVFPLCICETEGFHRFRLVFIFKLQLAVYFFFLPYQRLTHVCHKRSTVAKASLSQTGIFHQGSCAVGGAVWCFAHLSLGV